MGMLLHRHFEEQKITVEPVKSAPAEEEKTQETTSKDVKKTKKK